MHRYFLFLLGVYVLGACTSTEMLTSNRNPASIKQLDFFESYAYINVIEKKNQSQVSDSLSMAARQLIDSMLHTKSNLKIHRKLSVDDPITKYRIEREITALMDYAIRQRSVRGMELTPTIDSIMTQHNSDFALAIHASGFTRGKGNYGKQVAKGIGVGLLTLGLYTPVPIKSNSTIHLMIFDRPTKSIAFYRSSFVEKEPLNKETIPEQVKKLLTQYFFR